MKVFVTGGSGFVGRNLITALVARGDHVVALARSDAAAAAVEKLGARSARGDLSTLTGAEMAGSEVVFHAAAHVKDWGPREEFFQATVEGTERTLEAARRGGVRRFVHVSTEAVLCDGKAIIDADESRPRTIRPVGLYPLTKALAEEKVASASGIETVIIRPRLIWGRGDTSLLPQFVEAVKSGKFAWIGGGNYLTSSCHVENVVEGALLAAERGRPGEAYFLTDGPPILFREFMTAMLKSQGVDPGTKSVPRPLVRMAAWAGELAWRTFNLRGSPPVTRTAVSLLGQQVTVSDEKARRELGYRGHKSRERGLAEMG